MPAPERFSVLAPLPPHGDWRRALALERAGAERRAVVLAWVPPATMDDPERLVSLLADVEAAGRLQHPGVAPVLGSETVDDALAVVEAHRPGTPLRALLDAGGRLPPDVAVRIVADACDAVAAAHALGVEGKPLVHGALAPSRILVGDDGAAVVLGFGTGGPADAAADVRALAAVLHECLAGEPPRGAASSLEEAGVPGPLAVAVARGLAAGTEAPLSAAALGEAVASAGPVASRAEVAHYVDAILPPEEGSRGELARALSAAAADALEVSASDIMEPTDPAVRAALAAIAEAAPAATSTPAAATSTPTSTATPTSTPAATPTATPAAAPTAVPPPPTAGPVAPPISPAPPPRTPVAEPTPEPLPRPPSTRPGVDPAGVFAAPVRPPSRSRAPAVAALLCALVGFAAGLTAERTWRASRSLAVPREAATAPAPPSDARRGGEVVPVPASERAAAPPAAAPSPAPAPAKRPAPGSRSPATASAKPTRAAAPAKPAAKKGKLKVAAPEDAEVFLDGRRIGRGDVHLDVPVGTHRVEVRRGEARVGESFTVAADETWTYDVTPTPPPAN